MSKQQENDLLTGLGSWITVETDDNNISKLIDEIKRSRAKVDIKLTIGINENKEHDHPKLTDFEDVHSWVQAHQHEPHKVADKIVFLAEELEQLANFNPDWNVLQATRESLRKHMKHNRHLEDEIIKLREEKSRLNDARVEISEGYFGREREIQNLRSVIKGIQGLPVIYRTGQSVFTTVPFIYKSEIDAELNKIETKIEEK